MTPRSIARVVSASVRVKEDNLVEAGNSWRAGAQSARMAVKAAQLKDNEE